MDLGDEEVFTSAQDAAYVHDAGDFFVLREEARLTGDEVVGLDLTEGDERVRGWIILRYAGEAGVVAGVFIGEQIAVRIRTEVVHHDLAFRAVQHHVAHAAEFRLGDVREAQAPHPAGLGRAGGGDEVEVVRMGRIPRAVFHAHEAGHAVGVAHVF